MDQSCDDGDDLSAYPLPTPSESGVVTKCEVQAPPDQNQKTFEMKVNISGTEFVLLENLGTRDTNAVVLKVRHEVIRCGAIQCKVFICVM